MQYILTSVSHGQYPTLAFSITVNLEELKSHGNLKANFQFLIKAVDDMDGENWLHYRSQHFPPVHIS